MGFQNWVLPSLTPERRREPAPQRLLAWLRPGRSDAVSATRQDIERQKGPDLSWGDFQGTLHKRVTAVIDAQAAVAQGEPSARYRLRQACVDLASAAELAAEELPRPRR
jgi:hypothetical protein